MNALYNIVIVVLILFWWRLLILFKNKYTFVTYICNQISRMPLQSAITLRIYDFNENPSYFI